MLKKAEKERLRRSKSISDPDLSQGRTCPKTSGQEVSKSFRAGSVQKLQGRKCLASRLGLWPEVSWSSRLLIQQRYSKQLYFCIQLDKYVMAPFLASHLCADFDSLNFYILRTYCILHFCLFYGHILLLLRRQHFYSYFIPQLPKSLYISHTMNNFYGQVFGPVCSTEKKPRMIMSNF